MRVDDQIRKSIVYVGDANEKPFLPHGTGFIAITFIDDFGYQSVVTARHVLEGIEPDVHLRLNRLDGGAQVIPLQREMWRDHPSGEVDLVACPTLIPKDEFFHDLGGTRHQSAARFCSSNPNSIAFVVSQDGSL